MRGLLNVNTQDVWFTDSGASRHITYRREWFEKFLPTGDTISLGDDGVCDVAGVGTVLIEKLADGK